MIFQLGADVEKEKALSKKVLVVTALAGAQGCVRSVAEQVGAEVELAMNRKAALHSLRHGEYAVVVVEESLAESDPEWAEEMREASGLAMPVHINFAISGCARLGREVKTALLRREKEQWIARRQAKAELQNELKSSVTGLLLESELALLEPTVSASLELKLRHLVELAGAICERLRGEADRGIAV